MELKLQVHVSEEIERQILEKIPIESLEEEIERRGTPEPCADEDLPDTPPPPPSALPKLDGAPKTKRGWPKGKPRGPRKPKVAAEPPVETPIGEQLDGGAGEEI